MTAAQALAFIRKHGVVLISAKGALPCLTEAIAGEPIRGSWWGHPKGREIFRILQRLDDAPELLCCRLVGGKLTLVHRRLWPALVRLAHRFPAAALAQVRQEHTTAGHHVSNELPFPRWVPGEVLEQARFLDEVDAIAALHGVLPKA
jgi:hypothetical protein